MGSTQTAGSRFDWRELATRQNNGLAIALLWSKAADRVKVMVADHDAAFELDIENADALEAFYHPFAYQARQLQPQG